MNTAVGHPYPTVRVGGLWLVVIGVTMVAASLFAPNGALNGPLFFLGFAAGVAGVLVNRKVRAKLSFGQMSGQQRTAMWFGLGLQTLLFVGLGNLLRDLDPRTFWLVALMVVGLHLLPFGFVHGPRAGVLGLLCIANALVALRWSSVPFLPFGVADGLLKTAFGYWMLITRPMKKWEGPTT